MLLYLISKLVSLSALFVFISCTSTGERSSSDGASIDVPQRIAIFGWNFQDHNLKQLFLVSLNTKDCQITPSNLEDPAIEQWARNHIEDIHLNVPKALTSTEARSIAGVDSVLRAMSFSDRKDRLVFFEEYFETTAKFRIVRIKPLVGRTVNGMDTHEGAKSIFVYQDILTGTTSIMDIGECAGAVDTWYMDNEGKYLYGATDLREIVKVDAQNLKIKSVDIGFDWPIVPPNGKQVWYYSAQLGAIECSSGPMKGERIDVPQFGRIYTVFAVGEDALLIGGRLNFRDSFYYQGMHIVLIDIKGKKATVLCELQKFGKIVGISR
ncbi:MAG: hypothetical protein ABL876_19260 [Chitinophagaceae bacterium]